MSENNRNEYFATLPTEDIGAELVRRIEDWYQHMAMTGVFRKIHKSYNAYYGYNSNGAGHTASEIVRSGEQGELNLVKVNHLRNLVQHLLVMTTSTRPAMDARAINTDYRSLAQTTLANGILDYYLREKKLERYLKLATEYALVFGEGFIRMEWNATQGTEYVADPETNQIKYTGDIEYSVLNPLDVVRDLYAPDCNNHDWLMIRHFKNRFELIAKYPEFREEILEVETKDNLDFTFNINFKLGSGSDLIPVYEFYHKKSDALPDGRQVVFISKEAVFYDGPLPYKEIPIYRIAPADFIGTPNGYSVAFDLTALQESVDALYSIILTNNAAFGVQNILIPQGANIAYNQLSGSLNVIEYDPNVANGAKPEALQLTHTAPETFNFLNKMEQAMETISGVNSVARGNPEANLRSGNALALIQSMALQFNSGLQQSYAQLVEDVGTATLTTLRDFAAVPRVAMIVGQSNRSYMQEFTGNDLDKIDRVVVDLGNPLSKTTAGKLEMANNLLQQGLIKRPEDYIMVMKTGNLDTMMEGDMAELMNIKSENELLAKGQSAIVVTVDNHALHIKEHKSVIASPQARQNPQIVNAVLGHIQDHINELRNVDPGLLNVLGYAPLPPAPPPPGAVPPGPPQGPGSPPPSGGPGPKPQMGPQPNPNGGPSMPAVINAQNSNPNLPSPGVNFPKNPLTGQRFNPQTGGR